MPSRLELPIYSTKIDQNTRTEFSEDQERTFILSYYSGEMARNKFLMTRKKLIKDLHSINHILLLIRTNFTGYKYLK